MATPQQISGISLFSGVGMLDEGVKLALAGRGLDYRTAAFCEWESGAASTILARLEEQSLEPCFVWGGDLRDFPAESFAARIGILTAGYPCQPFSVAGKQRGLEDERALGDDGNGPIAQLLRIIAATRPVLVFLENVPQALKHFRPIGRELERLGYEVAPPLILAAEDVGANHKRERVFILAKLADCTSDDEWWRAFPPMYGERVQTGGRGSTVDDSGLQHVDLQQRAQWISESEGANGELGDAPNYGLQDGDESSGDRPEFSVSGMPIGAMEDSRCPERGGSEEPEQFTGQWSPSDDSGASGALADPELATVRELEADPQDGERIPSGRSSEGVEDASRALQREQRTGRERTGAAMQELAQPTSKGSQGGRRSDGTSRRKDQIGPIGLRGGKLFAPGPSDRTEWERTLFNRGYLAPAIESGTCLESDTFSNRLAQGLVEQQLRRALRGIAPGRNRRERRRSARALAAKFCRVVSASEEVEPSLRLLADGMAHLVDASRADQLRCCGNGVVALQGATAFELLLREFESPEHP